jgi:hypothetical protein
MTSTTLERVIRPGESVPTPFGSGYYTYIAPHVDNTTISDSVSLTFSAKTSAKTTEIKGIGYQLETKKKNSLYKEVSRHEQEVTITNPDDPDQTAKFKVPKDIGLKPANPTDVPQRLYFAHPNADNSRMVPAGEDDSGGRTSTPVTSDPPKATQATDSPFGTGTSNPVTVPPTVQPTTPTGNEPINTE